MAARNWQHNLRNLLMLKKLNRLPSAQKLNNPTYLKTHAFTLKISRNTLANNRFAFTVKKTIDKRARVRNRAKRVLRSCIEELLNEISVGYDMLFLLEKGIIDRKRELVFKDIHTLLSEKGFLK